jgi:hypothetical protein
MSSALAVAGVTAVLRDLLIDGLIDNDVSGAVGNVTVSLLPPDRVVSGTEASQLNLFLYQVSPNSGWRNEGLPSRDGSGRQRLANAPLALNLHYLLSANSAEDLHAEILLGYAMQLLHETPVLTRGAIRTALHPAPDVGATLPPALRALADSGLEDQVEQIKITPESLSTEDLSKLWSATLSHLRPSAAYMASVVLIQAREPARAPLPVITRNVRVEAGSLPLLEAVTPASGQPVVELNEVVVLRGRSLAGSDRTVLLRNETFGIQEEIAAASGGSGNELRFTIPLADAARFPVGTYRVSLRLQPPGEPKPRTTNQLALTLAPSVTGMPPPVVRNAAGAAQFSLSVQPPPRDGQQAAVVLGDREVPAQPFTAPTTTLNFVVPDAPAAPAPGLLVRLRIDGIDSPIIDLGTRPPTFRDQRLVIA